VTGFRVGWAVGVVLSLATAVVGLLLSRAPGAVAGAVPVAGPELATR
jgi:hypothetical protein